MTLLTLLNLLYALSPDLTLIVVYDDGEIFISGYTVDYVKQQADFFDAIGDDTYRKLQLKEIDVIDYDQSKALHIYCELLDV